MKTRHVLTCCGILEKLKICQRIKQKKKLDYRSSRNDVVGQFWDTLIPFLACALLGSDSVELKFELRLTEALLALSASPATVSSKHVFGNLSFD